MTELTTRIVNEATPDQAGTTKPAFWDLESLAIKELDAPAEVEPTGPCEADAQWWADQNQEDEAEPVDRETDLDHYEEMLDALALEASYHETLEALGYSRFSRPLTDADVQTNGGCVG